MSLTVRRNSRIRADEGPVLGLRETCLKPVEARGAALLETLSEREGGAVVAAAGD